MADSILRIGTSDEDDLRTTLGRRLRQVRKQKGMTMVILGQASACSQSFLSKVESGHIIPSLPMLHRIARALAIKPSLLLSDPIQSLGDQTEGRLIVSEQEP